MLKDKKEGKDKYLFLLISGCQSPVPCGILNTLIGKCLAELLPIYQSIRSTLPQIAFQSYLE